MAMKALGAILLNIWLADRAVANSPWMNGADLHTLILSAEHETSASSAGHVSIRAVQMSFSREFVGLKPLTLVFALLCAHLCCFFSHYFSVTSPIVVSLAPHISSPSTSPPSPAHHILPREEAASLSRSRKDEREAAFSWREREGKV